MLTPAHTVRAALLLATTGVLALAPLPALADGSPPTADRGRTQTTTASAADGAYDAGAESTDVVVSTTGATTDGAPFSSQTHVSVPRRCWYGPTMSGKTYYDYWTTGPGSGGTLSQYAAQGLLIPHFEVQATETTGLWYQVTCASSVPTEEYLADIAAHPGVYVMPGQPAPAVEEGIDPAVLAQAAVEHMQLPTGTIRWKIRSAGSGATVVNVDTWIWVQDAATRVEVTASVPGVSSTVQATLASMALSARGADPDPLPDLGTAYTAEATATTCSILFTRSSAGQPVQAGQTQPTFTLTASATWAATWTSSLDPTPRDLGTQTVTTTAQIPVAEIEALVTG